MCSYFRSVSDRMSPSRIVSVASRPLPRRSIMSFLYPKPSAVTYCVKSNTVPSRVTRARSGSKTMSIR